MSRIGFVAAALAMLVSLAGCTTKVTYNFLDYYAMWKIQRLVALEGDHKDQTRQAVDDFHQWHRHTQLPQYAQYLESLKTRLSGPPLSAQDIHAETDKLQELMDQSLRYLQPRAATFLAGLRDEQAQELLASLAEEREEYIEEYIDISQRKREKKRREELSKYAKSWLGSINDTQETWIHRWSETLEPYEELSARQQKVWEEDIAQLLAIRDDREALSKGLRELMFYRTDNWQAELAAILDRNQTRTYQLLAQLLKSIDKKQREHLLEKIDHYIDVFSDLADD